MMLLLGAALAGVTPTAPGSAGGAYAPRRVAVVIGIQDYADPALQGLRYATKDATDLGTVLESPDVGGFDRVFVIQGAASTTRAALARAIKVATADLQRDDTFLLYLSGHGTLTLDPLEGSRMWILPSDGRIEDPEHTGLAVADLETLVNALPARRRVLILDTCHNGRTGSKSSLGSPTAQLLHGLRGEVPAPLGEREVSESEARLFAAQYYQPAMEDPTLQNGVYTHFLIAGLTSARSAADLDKDGLVDVGEAHQYARDHTITYTGGLQVPRAEYRVVGREDIYLSGRQDMRTTAERALFSAYDQVLDRARILVNGTPRGELPGLVAVDPGAQVVEVQTPDGRRLLKEHVHLDAGASIAVEDLLRARASTVEVLGGGTLVAGTPLLHPLGGGVQVGWVRPFAATSGRWRPDVHVAADVASGPGTAGTPLTTGMLAVGGTWALDAGALYAGPSVDLRLPWRVDGATGWAEMDPAPSAGLTAGCEFDVGRVGLDVRGDAWGGSVAGADGWLPLYGGSVRVGLTQ